METFFSGSLVTACYSCGASFYYIFSMNTKFSMNKWTRLQWGGLVSATALSIIRPHIQEKIDKSRLGEKTARLFFDLTPFFVLGLTTWQATKLKKGSLLTGAYFATVSKVCNWTQHLRAYYHVFDRCKSYYYPYQKAAPRNYYEELALRRGKENPHAQEALQLATEEGNKIYGLALIQTGQVAKGTEIFYKNQSPYENNYIELWNAQISSYLRENKHQAACRVIQKMEKLLDDRNYYKNGKVNELDLYYSDGYYDEFLRYQKMIDAYVKMEKMEELQKLLEKMMNNLAAIEKGFGSPFCTFRFRRIHDMYRTMIAKGYCYLKNQMDKVVELMNVQDIPIILIGEPFSEIFKIYFQTTLGTEIFDPDFHARFDQFSHEEQSLIRNSFNRCAILAYTSIDRFDLARAWIEKIADTSYLLVYAASLIKKGKLDEAELIANQFNNKYLYSSLAKAHRDAGNADKAIAMVKKCGNRMLMVSFYLTLQSNCNSYENELRELLKDPDLHSSTKVKILHSLGEDVNSYIEKLDYSFAKANAYLTLVKLTKNIHDFNMAKEMAIISNYAVYHCKIAKAYVRLNKKKLSFELLKEVGYQNYGDFGANSVSKWIIDGFIQLTDNFTEGMFPLEAIQFRVAVAKELQKQGQHQFALEVITPVIPNRVCNDFS